MKKSKEEFMKEALKEAFLAYEENEVPVGAVIVYKNQIIARSHNQREKLNSPLAHAEILAIETASKVLNTWKLNECQLYVTLEPCIMCSSVIVESRIGTIVYGAKDIKKGSLTSVFNLFLELGNNYSPHIFGGVCDDESHQLLEKFFSNYRSSK